MLSFDIRSLESHAAVVDEDLSANDPVWEADDPKPEGAVARSGRLSAAGPGRFYWHGRSKANIALECSRCLDRGARARERRAHLIFAEPGDEDTDDPDVYQLDPQDTELDLRPAIREQWLLAAPASRCAGRTARVSARVCGADLQCRNDARCGRSARLIRSATSSSALSSAPSPLLSE